MCHHGVTLQLKKNVFLLQVLKLQTSLLFFFSFFCFFSFFLLILGTLAFSLAQVLRANLVGQCLKVFALKYFMTKGAECGLWGLVDVAFVSKHIMEALNETRLQPEKADRGWGNRV